MTIRKAAARKPAKQKTAAATKAKRPTKAAANLAAIADAVSDQKARDAAAPSKRAKPTPRTRVNKKGLVLYVDPAVTVQLAAPRPGHRQERAGTRHGSAERAFPGLQAAGVPG